VSDPGKADRFGAEYPLTRAAVVYAEQSHAGQRRKCDDAPFILHPLEVAALLQDAGAHDELVAAGVLHDVIEKTTASEADLRQRFGARVTTLVRAVSENPKLAGYAERKTALREQVADAGEEALMLFAADKLAKVRELRRGNAKAPARRLLHYRRSAELLEALLPRYSLTRKLAAELERLPGAAALGTATG
jgi:(p)ppGpp synthase/HD superfamily hydrolase